mmetsp:Transcript_15334/g.59966  ORF Transcript_15334/g.59966 Transcript_15334/m.59966 type:complete len:248 (-) Transcript_15334:173-916(-)
MARAKLAKSPVRMAASRGEHELELLVFHLAGAIRVHLVERRLEVPALEVTRGPLVQALHVTVPARALRQRRKRLELSQRNRPRAIRVVLGEPRVPQVSQRPLKLRALLLLSLHVRQADVPPALRVESDVPRAAQALPGVFAGLGQNATGIIRNRRPGSPRWVRRHAAKLSLVPVPVRGFWTLGGHVEPVVFAEPNDAGGVDEVRGHRPEPERGDARRAPRPVELGPVRRSHAHDGGWDGGQGVRSRQ